MQTKLPAGYVYLDTEERSKHFKKHDNYLINLLGIPINDCYRVYSNFIILFVEEKVGNIKYSTYKKYKLKN